MATLQELKDAVAALTAEAQAANASNGVLLTKVDALIALTDTIKDQLVQLSEGGLLPPDALSQLTTAINDSITQIHAIGTASDAESGKVDTTLARDADTSGTDSGTASDASGTPAADSSAPTDGSDTASTDSSSTENTTETQ